MRSYTFSIIWRKSLFLFPWSPSQTPLIIKKGTFLCEKGESWTFSSLFAHFNGSDRTTKFFRLSWVFIFLCTHYGHCYKFEWRSGGVGEKDGLREETLYYWSYACKQTSNHICITFFEAETYVTLLKANKKCNHAWIEVQSQK